MAHINYICCAVCDSEIMPTQKEGIKTAICTKCDLTLKDLGHRIMYADDFIDLIEEMDADGLVSFLKRIGYRPCIYTNDVDFAVYNKIYNRVAIFE